jgi:hypothetical protein
MAKKQKISFKADQITFVNLFVTKFSLDFHPSLVKEEIDGYEMKMGKELKYNFEAKMCRVTLEFEFLSDTKKEEEKACAKITIETHFHIANFDELLEHTDLGVKIDMILPAHLVSMAYSTARGVILERLQSSPFRGLIIPIIDPYKEMLEH